MAKWIDIVDIERSVRDTLKDVCDNVFINNAPVAVSEKMSSFIVADILGNVNDYHAYKNSYVYFTIYVRNRKSGVQDSVNIDALTNGVMELFPIKDDGYSIITPRLTYGRKVNDFVTATIRCEIII